MTLITATNAPSFLEAPVPLRRSRAGQSQIGAVLITLFLTAGSLKVLPLLGDLPLDFTVLSVVMVIGFAFYCFFRNGTVLPRASMLVPAFFISTLPTFFWSSFGEYTLLKAGTFLAFTLTVSICAPIIVQTRSGVRAVLLWSLLIGVLMSVDSIWLRPGTGELGRLRSLGNEIELGRTTGQAMVVLFVLALWVPKRLVFIGPTTIVLGLALVGAGSRGSFVALPIAVMVVALLSRKLKLPILYRSIVIGVLLFGAGYAALGYAPAESAARLTDTSQLGASGRDALYRTGLELLPRVPLGIGWGDWGDYVDIFQGDIRLYPHNLFLEIGVELGWLPLSVMVVVIIKAFQAVLKERGSIESDMMLGVLTFVLITTQFSGDLSDNRHLFVLLVLAKHLESLPWDGLSLKVSSGNPQLHLLPAMEPLVDDFEELIEPANPQSSERAPSKLFESQERLESAPDQAEVVYRSRLFPSRSREIVEASEEPQTRIQLFPVQKPLPEAADKKKADRKQRRIKSAKNSAELTK